MATMKDESVREWVMIQIAGMFGEAMETDSDLDLLEVKERHILIKVRDQKVMIGVWLNP